MGESRNTNRTKKITRFKLKWKIGWVNNQIADACHSDSIGYIVNKFEHV